MFRLAVFFLMCTGLVAGQSFTQHEYEFVDNMRYFEPNKNVIQIRDPSSISFETCKHLCDSLEESCVGFIINYDNLLFQGYLIVINPTKYIPSLIPYFNDKSTALQATTKYEFDF